MKLQRYITQTDNISLVKLDTEQQAHDFLSAASSELTEKLNAVIKSAPSPVTKSEVRWLRIMDKHSNPRGENGFWDIVVYSGEDDGTRNHKLDPFPLDQWQQINV